MQSRLIHESSPYLQQHAHNPVDWYPWCDEVFEKAKAEEKPIFLSIGYSSCHWCHVMEKEVFEQERFAMILNESFVSIKVDREERPDIDKYYQEVHFTLTRRPGGWPTSIFLTHEAKPFFAGTYIPPERKYGMPGFGELLEHILIQYREKRTEIIESSQSIVQNLKMRANSVPNSALPDDFVSVVMKQAGAAADKVGGGFSQAPKFPHAPGLELLLQVYALMGDVEIRNILDITLKNMVKGGLWDLVDKGFCRYSVDDEWLVPHFEKMTYDNALLAKVYAKAGRVLDDPLYARIAQETVGFMEERMQEDGLCYSASDADTEEEEGKYFVYGHAEVREVLQAGGFSEEGTERFVKQFGVSRIGNFERQNILRNESLEDSELGEKGLALLKKARESREYPFIDKKVITAWNAMMIETLFVMGRESEAMLALGRRSLEKLLATMWVEGTLYHSALIGETPKIEAFLEDYAFLVKALVGGHQATGDSALLLQAVALAEKAQEKFYVKGRWYFSVDEFETVADGQDMSYAASIGVLLDGMMSLALLHDPKWRDVVEESIRLYAAQMGEHAVFFGAVSQAALKLQHDLFVIKAPPMTLQEYRREIHTLSYPFVLTLPDQSQEGFQLCTFGGCLMQGNFDEVRQKINELTSHKEEK